MRYIDEEFISHPTHGVLQIQDFLFALGYIVNVNRVHSLLRKMDIMAFYPKRNLSKVGAAHVVLRYLGHIK